MAFIVHCMHCTCDVIHCTLCVYVIVFFSAGVYPPLLDSTLSVRQTQLSLSKLALLASDSDSGTGNRNGDMSELTRQLDIIEYQMNIPDSVLEVSCTGSCEME